MTCWLYCTGFSRLLDAIKGWFKEIASIRALHIINEKHNHRHEHDIIGMEIKKVKSCKYIRIRIYVYMYILLLCSLLLLQEIYFSILFLSKNELSLFYLFHDYKETWNRFLFHFKTIFLYSQGWPETHYVAKAGLKLSIPLP
jgi:hypothetical protein